MAAGCKAGEGLRTCGDWCWGRGDGCSELGVPHPSPHQFDSPMWKAFSKTPDSVLNAPLHGVPPIPSDAPVCSRPSALGTQKMLLLQLVRDHQPVWSGLCPSQRYLAFHPDCSASTRETDRPRPRYNELTCLPDPREALHAWQTRGAMAPAAHKYRGELCETDRGFYRLKMVEHTHTQKRLTISSFMQFNLILWILCSLSRFPKALD